ncbi:MAG: TerC family protein [Saprospiraceae bacterium]|nr:TerC family protein [Saprospiraceae bacterium]MBK7738850.1 TerC family protein [Saprospiraceae bacterium]MBK7912579.1 TerC family protein [Saprospiraceae bacterium]
MEWLFNPDVWIAFLTLCALEIVLGIDNLIFISILANKLPKHQQRRARQIGLSLALVIRIMLLFSISWIMGLTNDFFTIGSLGFSGRDIILIIGGLFLLIKSVREIHEKIEHSDSILEANIKNITFHGVVLQIILIDIVFSLDSVITAVGMVDQIAIMIAAVIVSMIIMMMVAGTLNNFINNHPAIKILALAFLLMIGTALIAEGLDFHIPKGYIYYSMAFAVFVEIINVKIGSRTSSKAK